MSIQKCCAPSRTLKRDFSTQAELFKALADPHRAVILATLARAAEEVCVCDFVNGLPLNQPTVSHHLKILRAPGLVTAERRGTWVHYALSDSAHKRIAAALEQVIPQKVLA